jgi:DNA repair protein RadC
MTIISTSLILGHNHPSGNLEPSEADKQITNKIAEGGKLLEISVFDHVIIANNQYYSFADGGIL